MGVFGWLKKASGKAEDVMDQTKKDISETADKIQETLNQSSKGVQTIVEVITIALGISILTNIITIGLNISNHKFSKHSIVIQNLYLETPKK